MPFYVYIRQSQVDGSFYKGHTDYLLRRLKEYNDGKVTYSRKFRSWMLVWYGLKDSKTEAYALELKLKNLSNQRIIAFVKKYPPPDGSIPLQHLRVLTAASAFPLSPH